MAIKGTLSEFSLSELFRLLEQTHKTGLLTLRTVCEDNLGAVCDNFHNQVRNFYIWFSYGRIVAASNRLDHKGLITLIHQRGWLSDRIKMKLRSAFQSQQPFGMSLKCQDLLTAEQLKQLFYTQVMRQVCTLFQFQDGWFNFEPTEEQPFPEMTGLSAQPTDVTLNGLRVLRNWSALASKLPAPTSSIISVVAGKPQLKLNQLEWRIWEYASGNDSLQSIADSLGLSLEKTQHVAFRLSVVGLIEEVPSLVAVSSDEPKGTAPEDDFHLSSEDDLSQSFLQNLTSFLKGKVAA
jgi:hypothetical protein